MKNELVIVEDVVSDGMEIAKIFKPEMTDDILQRARDKYLTGIVADASTKEGREEIRSRAMKPVRAKTTFEKAGAEYLRWLKKEPNLVSAEKKRLSEGFNAIRDEIRAPLTEWENVRKEIDEGISYLNSLTVGHPVSSECIAEEIEILLYTSSADIVEDKRKEYDEALQRALAAQFGFLAEAITAENDAEELERLRLEKEAKEAEGLKQKEIKAARAAAKKEAEEAAARAILQAQLDKAEAEKEAQKAKDDKDEAEKKAKEAEEAKVKAEKEAKELKEESARNRSSWGPAIMTPSSDKPDEGHRDNVHNAIRQAFMDDGLNWGQAQIALDAIVGGRVPHIDPIKY